MPANGPAVGSVLRARIGRGRQVRRRPSASVDVTSCLVLPYRHVTHSGQLELALDTGVPVVAPDVPTLRVQLEHSPVEHAVAWFNPTALTSTAFGSNLADAVDMVPPSVAEHRRQWQRRSFEHDRLITVHAGIYGCGAPIP